MSCYISTVPREKRYGRKYKKVLYLEPPFDGAVTVKKRVTTIVPPPQPPPPPPAFMMPVQPQPEPVPSIIDVAPLPPRAPRPPPAFTPEEEPESPIDVIAVDVDPSEAGSSRTSKSSRSSHGGSKRHSRSRDCEVYVERERLVPVPVRVPVPYPVAAEPPYDTFRYVEAPRHYEPPRRRSLDHDIIIEDHHRRRYIRD
ncbi:hypothetical protein F5Y14DRAFT_313799 [Nemania sp. NC0429]|nr:hypothetical protein F5Y14DRAFT_313799 [Nemania sp. NC0429]